MRLDRRVNSLEKSAATNRGGMCACSPPVVVWETSIEGLPLSTAERTSPGRCDRCRRPREVIRVVFERTRPPHDAEDAA